MNKSTKTELTIKDLESLSGIKAHTIRIWEKRYGILFPDRTETNIRLYSHKSLQKLLNVSLLNKNGIKISKIAEMPEDKIILHSRELAFENIADDEAINSLKLATIQFDKVLFNTTYNRLSLKKTFREIFKDVFVPFFETIGLLWQTNTISAAHEHFISNLIIQKIQLNTEKIDTTVFKSDKTYVLFLPENEIHEIGLLYLNYELALRSFKTIYLGQNLPLDNLNLFIQNEENITFITSLTIYPYEDELTNYINKTEDLLKGTKHNFIAFGKQTRSVSESDFSSKINFYPSLFHLIQVL